MQRRNFIKQSMFLSGGILLHEQLLAEYRARNAERKITIGVIGCGDRGKGVVSIIQQMPEQFSIKAVCGCARYPLVGSEAL